VPIGVGKLKKASDESQSLLNSSTTNYQNFFKNNENKNLKNVGDYDYDSSSDEYQYDDAIVTTAEVHSSSIAEPIIASNGMNDYFNEWAQNNNGFNSDLINIEPQPSILRNQTEVESVTSETPTRLNINPRRTFDQFLVNENNNWSDNDFSFNGSDDESQNLRLNLATDNGSLNNLLEESLEESKWSNPHSLVVDVINESKWNNCENRYGGISQKRKVNGNWEYKTKIWSNKGILKIQINEEFMKIKSKLFWIKRIHDLNTNKIILELLYFDKTLNNKLRSVYKLYNNENLYLIDLPKLNVSYIEKTFTPVKQSKTIWQQNNNWYENLTTWSRNILHDSKKMLQGISYLTAVIGIRTIQRAFTVMVSGEDEKIDWEKLLKTINPIESPIEYGLTIPQSLISVLAIDVWKWGLTNIINEIKTLRTILGIRTTDSSYTEININGNQTPSNNLKGIFKLLVAKLGYWVPNHFMITCSSIGL